MDGDQSGCAVGTKWCLHDLLINQRPYNPNASRPRSFDLERDYGQANADHPIATSFLDEL